MSEVLSPSLRPLDERVLAALSSAGARAGAVAQFVHGAPAWECDSCGHVERSNARPGDRARWLTASPTRLRCLRMVDGELCAGVSRRLLATTPEQVREVREILRGLERVGLAWQAGGWWRRA